jgi:hypothetical protein
MSPSKGLDVSFFAHLGIYLAINLKTVRFWFVAMSAIFNDLNLIIGHDTLYIEDVFPSFEHNTTHSLVRSDFCALVWVFGLLKEAHLLMEGFSWHVWNFS